MKNGHKDIYCKGPDESFVVFAKRVILCAYDSDQYGDRFSEDKGLTLALYLEKENIIEINDHIIYDLMDDMRAGKIAPA